MEKEKIVSMPFIDCCKAVKANGLHLIRPSKDMPGQYDLSQSLEERKGWIWLDAVTANIVCQVYESLSAERQEILKKVSAGAILQLCWKVVN